MHIIEIIVKGLLVLFMIYTVGYIVQWIIGMCVSFSRFSHFHENRTAVQEILPDWIAKDHPVSAIIPAYNERDCILATIESLLQEDLPNLEIIMVDDGSTDQTVQKVLKFYDLHEFHMDELPGTLKTKPIHQVYRRSFGTKTLTLISKENGGKSDALNCGLNFCTSRYCMVMDADTLVERGSTRIMLQQFLSDPKTIVCAGAVQNSIYKSVKYRHLPLSEKCLVLFQALEYFRTFYMQRILFDKINANTIISGAFAMFDVGMIRAVGGYRPKTIGEDMELTMRLHAFCHAQGHPYRIVSVPEARCRTQVPFHYRDYYRQRRRWHIGMIQSMKRHFYMIGSRYYGWVGVVTGSFVVVYELLAPFIEILGLITLLLAYRLKMLNVGFALFAMALYALFVIGTEAVFLQGLQLYQIEPLTFKSRFSFFLISILEFFIFHPMNMVIKLSAFLSYRKHSGTWGINQRSETVVSKSL